MNLLLKIRMDVQQRFVPDNRRHGIIILRILLGTQDRISHPPRRSIP